MNQPKTIPQEVIEFASNSNEQIIFERYWKEYEVYSFDYSDEPAGSFWGLPSFMLYDGKVVRWANDKELGELMYLNNTHQ